VLKRPNPLFILANHCINLPSVSNILNSPQRGRRRNTY
jgi:hypothetical protein